MNEQEIYLSQFLSAGALSIASAAYVLRQMTTVPGKPRHQFKKEPNWAPMFDFIIQDIGFRGYRMALPD